MATGQKAGVDPIANFTSDLKPVSITGLPGSYGATSSLQLTVHQARRLRDSLTIVIDSLAGTPFDHADPE